MIRRTATIVAATALTLTVPGVPADAKRPKPAKTRTVYARILPPPARVFWTQPLGPFVFIHSGTEPRR